MASLSDIIRFEHTRFPELTYANPADPKWKHRFIQKLEILSGRDYFVDLYEKWQGVFEQNPETAMGKMLALLNIDLTIQSGSLPFDIPQEMPLVIVANHPYGIGDGVAILSLAEKMGRPFKILINDELLKIPEMEPYSLPISFRETKEAMKLNLNTRSEALRLLKNGTTIVVFPAGGVATAEKGFGKAADLPWKKFPARLIQSADAAVLPVYFEGQCTRLFHLASKVSPTIRTALLIREFRKLVGMEIRAHLGNLLLPETLRQYSDRSALTQFLHSKVFSLDRKVKPRLINQNRPM